MVAPTQISLGIDQATQQIYLNTAGVWNPIELPVGVVLISDLPTIAPTSGVVVQVNGYYAAGDGGGGEFYGVTGRPVGTFVDNGGTIILPSGGDGSAAWLRVGARASDGKWLGDALSVKYFGAKGDGSHDDTAAIQATINAFPSGNGEVSFPIGSFLVTSTVTVAQNRMHLVGAGIFATQIIFAPTANASCFSYTAGANSLYQCSLENMSFFSSDSTHVKTAISLNDIREFALVDVEIGGGVVVLGPAPDFYASQFWSDGSSSSIGLYTTGREALSVQRFKAYADKPLVLGPNLNFTTLDADHFHFQDCFFAATFNPCVTAFDGVCLTNVTFDGYQTWNLGTHGLYWNVSIAAIASYNLSINNVRLEQGRDPTAYAIYLNDPVNSIYNVSINNCRLDNMRNGVYARAIRLISITDSLYAGTAGTTALNVDATVNSINLSNFYAATGSAAVMTGQYLIWGNPSFDGTSPLPTNAVYANDVTLTSIKSDSAWQGKTFTLNAGATIDIGGSTTYGFLSVVVVATASSQIELRGGLAVTPVTIVYSGGGLFTAIAANPGTINIYWDGGTNTFKLENNTATPLNFAVSLTGSYSFF
jgi:hypothetical protein